MRLEPGRDSIDRGPKIECRPQVAEEKRMAKILVVDDEPGVRDVLSIILKRAGYAPLTAGNGVEALDLFQREPVDLVIEDLKMPEMDGIELLKRIKDQAPKVPVIIITAFYRDDKIMTVEAMRLGAYDYIKKPFNNDEILAVTARALEQKELMESIGDQAQISPPMDIVGNTPDMKAIFEIVKRVAPTDSTVLIQGESGTGKELIARAIHYTSLRSRAAFITVNCSAFTESLLESELFGHVKGSFTGAIQDKKGLLTVADGGTFFLDEVGEMSSPTQVKLLRVLEERQFYPVGSTHPMRIDVRFITATNKNLLEEVESGSFREDLYYRLNVIPIELPPLRRRKGDIPLLAGHFIAKHARGMQRPVTGLSPKAMSRLMEYNWPGNVRELENIIQRAIALARGPIIGDVSFVGPVRAASAEAEVPLIPETGIDLEARLEEIERKYIKTALERTEGNLTRAAELLGISFRSIRYKVKKLGIGKS
jgi:two-component system response regulator PilR (NtrC family)